MKLIYICGPYRAETRWEEECNVRRAETIGHMVAALGAYPIIPHSNTRPYFGDAQPAEFWLEGTLELMRRCDAVLLVGGWANSVGARAEKFEAEKLKIPVFDMTPALAAWLEETKEV